MIVLNKGTIEYIIVPVADTEENLTAIATANFDIVTGNDAQEPVVSAQPANTSGMKVLCLIDTSDMDEGLYDLSVYFTAGFETPRLGPIRFRVDD